MARILPFSLVAASLCARAVLAQPLPSPAPMLADAELSSVSFADADHGWAVGDRGVIWHTADGGRNWQLQRSPTACRLECVQFLDALSGWAVGGWTHPYTHHTHGVVLRTRDGGRTWQMTSDLTLPALKQVKFLDARRGWAVGDASPLYPSGVFRSEDGGREWTPVPKGATLGWTCADFRSDKLGVLAGRGGATGVATALEVRPSRTENLGPRFLRRLAMATEAEGWLVGDGGLVLATHDGGNSWSAPSSPLPDGSAAFDFRAVAALGSHCWIAGYPGTCVFRTSDGGRTWQTLATEQPLPIRALTFVDENRGWAVGSLGTILATRDGGRTWRSQRSGGARAAMLALFSDARRLPLEVFAQQSASEGCLGVAEILCRSDSDDDGRRAAENQRTHDAVVAAGGSQAETLWQFPLPHAEVMLTSDAVLAHLNAATGGNAAGKIEERIVRSIRTWRPEVVITEDVSPRGENPLAHITNQLVLGAVQRAADSAAYPEQTKLGLAPWKVKKIFSVQENSRQGTVTISPPQWSAGLARSLADVAESGRCLLVSDAAPPPASVALSLLVDHLPQNTGRRDIFSGIVILPGGEARRQPIEPSGGDLEKLARAAQKRHNVQQLLARIEKDSSRGAALLAQMNELTEGIGPRGSGELLFSLARRYQLAGKPDSAAETMQHLLQRYPEHPLADAAALWLVQYYASGEMAWRVRRPAKFPVQPASSDAALPPGQAPGVVAAGSIAAAIPGQSAADRAGRAVAVGKLIERSRPMLFADPAFRFPLLVAVRASDQEKQAEKYFASLAASAGSDPWGQCAVAEQCLKLGHGQLPKTIIPCVTAAARPQLDGRLDDEVWKGAKSVTLAAGVAQDPKAAAAAQAVLAFDEEFLYVAISCPKVSSADYSPDDTPRIHDANLTPRDRVELHLDIDRDYASFWTLAVDCRGFTGDRVFGDATWNPTWYVARGGDDQYWTAEIAVPLSELAPQPPKVRDVWAIGIQRIIPNVGLESATQPASVDVRPEGFGLLVFE